MILTAAQNQSDPPSLSRRNRLREHAMPIAEPRMTPAQMASLVDAALATPDPLSFLNSAVAIFRMVGRQEDSTAVAWLGCLYAEGEIEAVMGLWAAWRRGEDRSPVEAGQEVLRLKP